MIRFSEDGMRIYNCPICQDGGWVHPVDKNGHPDYSKAVPCRCRVPRDEQSKLKEGVATK